jgi:hypothetical protein
MPIISIIWRRRPTSSLRWLLSAPGGGRACGLTRSAKRAIASSIERVRLSKAAHCSGEVPDLTRVDDAERQPALARAAATVASKHPVASRTTRAIGRPLSVLRRATPFASRGTQNASTQGSEMEVEAIF